MSFDIILLGPQRRVGENTIEDVVDYIFRVSDGELSRDVGVGIPGQAINPVGEPQRTKEMLSKVAEAWLRLYLNRGFDPFKQSSGRVPDVPTEVADHWVDQGELPPSI